MGKFIIDRVDIKALLLCFFLNAEIDISRIRRYCPEYKLKHFDNKYRII
jgi:hypothetical protein